MNNNNRSKQTLDVPSSNANGKHSDSESEKELYEPTSRNVEQQIDTSQLKLFPRIWYFVKLSAKRTYSVCHTAGEKLAWFFGITKPKYHAELQRYDRMNAEEKEAWRQAFQDVGNISHIQDSIVRNKKKKLC